MAKFKVSDHILVPKHLKLSEKEKEAFFAAHTVKITELPMILVKDPTLAGLNVKENDIIVVERKSPTAGLTRFYRRVVNG